MAERTVASAESLVTRISTLIEKTGSTRPFLVCGHSFMQTAAYQELMKLDGLTVTGFHDYEPNPSYESVVKGLNAFTLSGSDLLLAVGGGSPMDVAKSIKAFVGMSDSIPYVNQLIQPNAIPLIAVPTTAGTGSEVTHFAVIYYHGVKQSISDASLLPTDTVLDPNLLDSLPDYTRKASMLDALCHSIESFWAVKATEESRRYARQAIRLWLSSYEDYLNNLPTGNRDMLEAANLAGKAINISTTTAAHAMAYKLTGTFGIAHGHAVAVCLPNIWRYMLAEEPSIELSAKFDVLAELFGQSDPETTIDWFEALLKQLSIEAPSTNDDHLITQLAGSVNPQRLGNNPMKLDVADLRAIYRSILK